MMIKKILVPKDFKFRILNQEYINFIKISNREEMEEFMIKIIKLILLNNEPAFEINGRRISRSKGSIIVNNIDIPIFKTILDLNEDRKKILLYLSLILCLLQNMYQADWHGPVSPGVFTCITADEAEIRHGANLTIHI